MEFKAELAYSAKGNLKSENVNKIWIFYFILFYLECRKYFLYGNLTQFKNCLSHHHMSIKF